METNSNLQQCSKNLNHYNVEITLWGLYYKEIIKNAGLDRVIFALGIRNIGSKAGKVLAEKFGDIDSLSDAPEEELTKIEDIGPIMAKSIVNFFCTFFFDFV